MSNSTTKRRSRKVDHGRPPKPYKDYPLTPHPAGYWCKSIRGKIHYFGRWGKRVQGKMERLPDDGWAEALDLYQLQKDDLYAGRVPRENKDGLTVAGLCNHFLTFKKARATTGELTMRSFLDYNRVAAIIVGVFGKTTSVETLNGSDFERMRSKLAETRGPVALAGEITRVRVVFNFAFKHALVDKPVKFGAGFLPPPRKNIRKATTANGLRMFESPELLKIIDAAPSAALRAMILVAINSGMGNNDIGLLPFSAVNMGTGWVDFPREKTATLRRFLLWPETLEAIQTSLAKRPKPKPGHENYIFLTRCGKCWSSDKYVSPLSQEFRKILNDTGLYRRGLGFYCLRRTFQTIGEEAGETACRFIMGHTPGAGDMSAVYRQRISDTRLRGVTDHVRGWLFGKGGEDDE